MPSMQTKEAEELAAVEYTQGEEAEGDEGEESNAGDDTTLYCFCQKVSYGEVRYRPSHVHLFIFSPALYGSLMVALVWRDLRR
jgi:hypothetical protein